MGLGLLQGVICSIRYQMYLKYCEILTCIDKSLFSTTRDKRLLIEELERIVVRLADLYTIFDTLRSQLESYSTNTSELSTTSNILNDSAMNNSSVNMSMTSDIDLALDAQSIDSRIRQEGTESLKTKIAQIQLAAQVLSAVTLLISRNLKLFCGSSKMRSCHNALL